MEELPDTLTDLTTVTPRVSITDFLLAREDVEIHLNELTTLQKLDLIKQVVETIKPYLRYFHEFQELNSIIYHSWEHDLKENNRTRIEFGSELNFGMKVMLITTKSDLFEEIQEHQRWKLTAIKRLAKGAPRFYQEFVRPAIKNGKMKYFLKEKILLTQSGKFFVAYFWFLQPEKKAHKIEIFEIDDITLTRYLDRSGHLFSIIIDRLQWVLESGIKRRKEQLEKLKKINCTLNRIKKIVR